MDIPKPIYDDFYKFVSSSGVLLLFVSITALTVYLSKTEKLHENLQLFAAVSFLFGVIILMWALNKWYENQKLHDAKLGYDTKLSELLTGSTEADIRNKQKKEYGKDIDANEGKKKQVGANPSFDFIRGLRGSIKNHYEFYRKTEMHALLKLKKMFPGLKENVRISIPYGREFPRFRPWTPTIKTTHESGKKMESIQLFFDGFLETETGATIFEVKIFTGEITENRVEEAFSRLRDYVVLFHTFYPLKPISGALVFCLDYSGSNLETIQKLNQTIKKTVHAENIGIILFDLKELA